MKNVNTSVLISLLQKPYLGKISQTTVQRISEKRMMLVMVYQTVPT